MLQTCEQSSKLNKNGFDRVKNRFLLSGIFLVTQEQTLKFKNLILHSRKTPKEFSQEGNDTDEYIDEDWKLQCIIVEIPVASAVGKAR